MPNGCICSELIMSPRKKRATERPNPSPGQKGADMNSNRHREKEPDAGFIKAIKIKPVKRAIHSKCNKRNRWIDSYKVIVSVNICNSESNLHQY